MSKLTIVVQIKARSGQDGALEQALREVVAPTHSEPGCIRFALHRSSSDKGSFLLVERWASQVALDEHLQQPYIRTLFEKMADLAELSVAEPFTLIDEGSEEKVL